MNDATETRMTPSITHIPLALLRTMRPKQWVKNGLIYIGLVFDAQLFVLDSFLRVTLAFTLFCVIAGTVYIINDLVDIEKDRQHPKKKNRPLPSGQLPVPVAIVAAVILPIVTLLVALFASPALALTLLVYLLLQIAYSFKLKSMAILDVLAIAGGFLLRVIAGVIVIEVARFSPWLYVVTGFAALFLAVGKRRQELVTLGEHARETRPVFIEYNLPLLDDMLRMVTTATLLTYVFYTFEAHPGRYGMMLTIPFAVFCLMRYLYIMHVQGKGSAPDEVLMQDIPIMIAAALWGLVVVATLYPGAV